MNVKVYTHQYYPMLWKLGWAALRGGAFSYVPFTLPPVLPLAHPLLLVFPLNPIYSPGTPIVNHMTCCWALTPIPQHKTFDCFSVLWERVEFASWKGVTHNDRVLAHSSLAIRQNGRCCETQYLQMLLAMRSHSGTLMRNWLLEQKAARESHNPRPLYAI